jgi:hypothetical protein
MLEHEAQPVRQIEFRVCRRSRKSRWVVRLGNTRLGSNPIYGVYLDKEQAVLDAIEAAQDALEAGCQAQVWLDDRSRATRVF